MSEKAGFFLIKTGKEKGSPRTTYRNYAPTAPPNEEGYLLPEVPPGRERGSGGSQGIVLGRLALP